VGEEEEQFGADDRKRDGGGMAVKAYFGKTYSMTLLKSPLDTMRMKGL
jgi:hypothetical protein